MKTDQSQSPANCPECKAKGKQCTACWRKRIHALAGELEMKVTSIVEAKPDKVPSKPLWEDNQ